MAWGIKPESPEGPFALLQTVGRRTRVRVSAVTAFAGVGMVVASAIDYAHPIPAFTSFLEHALTTSSYDSALTSEHFIDILALPLGIGLVGLGGTGLLMNRQSEDK